MERVIDLRHDILTLFILNNQLLRLKINKYYNALCANYIKEINTKSPGRIRGISSRVDYVIRLKTNSKVVC